MDASSALPSAGGTFRLCDANLLARHGAQAELPSGARSFARSSIFFSSLHLPPLTKPTTSLRSLRERPRENGSRLIVDRSCNRPADHLRAFTPAPFCRLIFFTPCCACTHTHMGTRKHILRKNYCSKVWGCGSALKTSCAAG